MQIVKKSVIWAESGTATKPNDVKIAAGWTGTPPEQPPAEWFNWILQSDELNVNSLIDGNNVFDTELSNVITAAGLTPDLTPSGPGDQVATAIFDSEAIGTGALTDGAVVDDKLGDDLDLGHIAGGELEFTRATDPTIDDRIFLSALVSARFRNNYDDPAHTTLLRETASYLYGGGIDIQNKAGLVVTDASAGVHSYRTEVNADRIIALSNGSQYFSMVPSGMVATFADTKTTLNNVGTTVEENDGDWSTIITPAGLRFAGNNQPVGLSTKYRKVRSNVSGVTWDEFGGTGGSQIALKTIGPSWVSPIPSGSVILGCTARYLYSGEQVVAPATLQKTGDSGGFEQYSIFIWSGDYTDPANVSNVSLTIEFAGV